jgi:histidinol-phosphate aminotransferase
VARARAKRPVRARLDRNESPFGTSRAVLAAWERQRTADPRKYGLNRYGDFFQTDLLTALADHYGLTVSNYTPVAGTGEAGTVLAAALLRDGGELLQSHPVGDPVSRPARAWGATVRRVPLDAYHRQDLDGLAAAAGPETRLVHVQNPLDPSGRSFSHAELAGLVEAVARRAPSAYVWVDESYAPYSTRADFPRSLGLIADDPDESRLVVSRTLATAHGLAGVPVGWLAASSTLTAETEGVTNGFFVPDAYGWANSEAGVSRMAEKALLALLSVDGEEHAAGIRRLNRSARTRLVELLERRGFEVVPSDASFVLCRAPGRYARGGLQPALRRAGVLVRGPRAWGRRYRGYVRISVGSDADLRALDRTLAGAGLRAQRRRASPAAHRAAAAPPGRRVLVAGAAFAVGGLAVRRAAERLTAAGAGWEPDARVALTRRALLKRAGLAAGAAGVLLGAPRAARAFPPDSFYDTFHLARMIYHENPVGPSPPALEAVRELIARGPRTARRQEEDDDHELIAAILGYNAARSPAVARLGIGHAMVTLGSAEGLFLAADTFVSGRTIVSEWPSYRIIRERVWQADGTVVDVLLDQRTWTPDYEAILAALREHPDAGLVHFTVQNNPIGTVLQRAAFDAFAERVFREHPGVVILADESDREFMEGGQAESVPDFPRYVADGKPLIHLQTMSHAFGLTGLRVGYLFAPPALIERMRARRIPRPVSVFGRAAAIAALRDPTEQIARSHQVVDEGRRYLYGELEAMGLRHLRSQGQYVMLDTGRPSGTAVWSGLIALGVLTRFGREWGMESWLRVNPGLPDENERFIGALRAVLSQPDPGNVPDAPVPLPRDREHDGLRRSLEAGLARDARLARRLPAFRDGVRVTPPAALRQ